VPASDHPSLDIGAIGASAVAHETAVQVALDEFAGRWRRRRQPSGQSLRRSRSTPIHPASGICAELRRFGRVDAVESDPFAVSSMTDARPAIISALPEATSCIPFGSGSLSRKPGPKYPAAPATPMAARIVAIPPALPDFRCWKLTTLPIGRSIPLIVRCVTWQK
jgi:hypothetical protein